MLENRVTIPPISYLGYSMLVWVKKMIGMNRYRHRNYFIWKLIKLIESGKIDKTNLSVTSVGKTDGVGAQAMAKFSAMCFARAYDLKYVHAPFGKLAHAEIESTKWTEVWEGLLRMNIEENILDRESMHVVGLGEYLEDPKLWKKKVVIAERHYHAFCELDPACGTAVSKDLQIRFNVEPLPIVKGGEFIIGVHVRRGDVSKHDADTKHRFTPNRNTIGILDHVIQVVRKLGYVPRVNVHTNGSTEELADFSIFPEVECHACAPAMETFNSLAKSNILIIAKSDFSMLAGIYCKGIVICDPGYRSPLPEWIDGTSKPDDLRRELENHLISKFHA